MQFMLYGENLVYLWMKKLCDEYNGGYWTYYKLSNGGYYMAPASYNMNRFHLWRKNSALDVYLSKALQL